MIIRFRQELDTAGFRQCIECAHHFRGITLELLQQQPGDAVGDLKSALKSSYNIQKQPVSGKIAFVCHLSANRAVLIIVKILVIFIEYGIVPQSHWLMHLEVKTYRRHNRLLFDIRRTAVLSGRISNWVYVLCDA